MWRYVHEGGETCIEQGAKLEVLVDVRVQIRIERVFDLINVLAILETREPLSGVDFQRVRIGNMIPHQQETPSYSVGASETHLAAAREECDLPLGFGSRWRREK